MKKTFLYLSLLLTFHVTVLAQDFSETELFDLTVKTFNHYNEGKYQEALEGFMKISTFFQNQRTEKERKNYILNQTMIVLCHLRLKQYESGVRLCEELLRGNTLEEDRKEIQLYYVLNGYCLGLSYFENGNTRYSEAREIFSKILPLADDDMRKLILPKIPLTWYYEGTRNQIEQKYDVALRCVEKALDEYHKIGNIDDEINCLCQIGSIKAYLYDTKGAYNYYLQASALATSIHDEVKLISILQEQRNLSMEIGDSEQTYEFTSQIDSLAASTKNNKVKYYYYTFLGKEAVKQGNYYMAEQWYLKNEPYINHLDANHIGSEKYSHYLNLCNLYIKLGKLDEAMKYGLLSKEESHVLRDEKDKNYYLPYMTISEIYKLKGDRQRCFQALDSLFIPLARLDEPREVRNLYVTRAGCHLTFKEYEQALADYKKADEIMATKYDENDGERIELLPLMGGAEYRLNHFDESERLYKKYAEGIKKLQGENHPNYINALVYLANAEGFADHIDAACNDYTTAVSKLKEQIQGRLPYYITSERESYWKSTSHLILNMTPFALESKAYQTTFTKSCYDGLVLSKAFLLESERSAYDIIKKSGTEKDLQDFNLIAHMQAKIKIWEKNKSEHTDSILELTSKVKHLETLLASRCRGYGNMTTFMKIDYQTIKSKLNDDDVLIDFTDFVTEKRGRVYAAYFLNNQQEFPLLKELFAESKIDSLKATYPDMYYEEPYSDALYNLIWMPFKDYITEGTTVYYVPSQLLFQIALESLPTKDGTLLGEHYHFVRLSSTREIMNIDPHLNIDTTSSHTNAILYGGLKYDLEENVMTEEAKKYNISPLLALRGDILRGDTIFRELPGSRNEIEAIELILKSQKLTVQTYAGKEGTEESFLNMNGQAPQILHIATHGFFYTPNEAMAINYLKGYEDAMSLSGLVMSGGNAEWLCRELPKEVLGGIITASDISRLDLSNTRLVVLSACHSGKGKATSEGLYGLQRAFKKAGVKTMIMSLWDVSDVVGTEFMTCFYKNLLDKDNYLNLRVAFDKTKLAIREKYQDEPFYWAGFIMID